MRRVPAGLLLPRAPTAADGGGCRNTALHVAAARAPANARAAMVAFLIAERADATKANKQGCAARRSTGARRPPAPVLRRFKRGAATALAVAHRE